MKHSQSSIENDSPLPPVLNKLRYDALFNNDLTRVLHEGFGFRGQLAKQAGRSLADKFAWSKFA